MPVEAVAGTFQSCPERPFQGTLTCHVIPAAPAGWYWWKARQAAGPSRWGRGLRSSYAPAALGEKERMMRDR